MRKIRLELKLVVEKNLSFTLSPINFRTSLSIVMLVPLLAKTKIPKIDTEY